jgi:hypothetical protein
LDLPVGDSTTTLDLGAIFFGFGKKLLPNWNVDHFNELKNLTVNNRLLNLNAESRLYFKALLFLFVQRSIHDGNKDTASKYQKEFVNGKKNFERRSLRWLHKNFMGAVARPLTWTVAGPNYRWQPA